MPIPSTFANIPSLPFAKKPEPKLSKIPDSAAPVLQHVPEIEERFPVLKIGEAEEENIKMGEVKVTPTL
jgi:hypothetical protein